MMWLADEFFAPHRLVWMTSSIYELLLSDVRVNKINRRRRQRQQLKILTARQFYKIKKKNIVQKVVSAS